MRSWTIVTLGDVTANGSEGLRRGPFGGAIKKDSFAPNGYKIYEQKHAIYGDFEAGTYFIGERHYKALQSFTVMPGDLIVSCSGTLGRVAIVPESAKPGIINQALLRIRPRPDVVSSSFFKMLLETPKLQSLLFGGAGGSAIKNVRPLSEIRKVQFQLPPMPEQRRIAAILDKAGELRAKRRSALAQLESLIQAMFLDLFGDPTTNPKGWPTKPLASLIREGDTINYGVVQPGDDLSEGVPLIRVGDLIEGSICHQSLKRIASSIEVNYKRSRLRGDEILVSCVGSIGVLALANESVKGYNIARAVARIPLAKTISRTFIAAYLKTDFVQRYFTNELRTVSQPTLNIKQLSETTIAVPPVHLQSEFDRRVAVVEKLNAAHSASLAEMDALFASIQHCAFRGEL